MNPLRFNFLPISFGISLFGLVFTAWNVLDFTKSFCITDTSCELFLDFAVLGISFWWFGVAFFTVTLVLSLFGFAYIGKLFAGLGVILDLFLLAIMFYTMPCINCLIAGLSIAALYYAFTYEGQRKNQPLPKPFLLVPWSILFLMILSSVISLTNNPWSITDNSNAKIHVYFSSGCSACLKLVMAQGDRTDIAWYPVQENDNDLWRIRFLLAQIKEGKTFKDAYLAMANHQEDAKVGDIFSSEHWKLQLQLWKNAAYVTKTGHNTLPFVEFQGLPSMLANSISNSTNNSTDNSVDALLGDIDALCGDDTAPCDEIPPQTPPSGTAPIILSPQ